jgi:signal transduction histidine kinase
MDEDTVSKMFESFFSNDPSATGLGLALVNDIVTLHEGFIDVRSNPGNGTIATIYLPKHGGKDRERDPKEAAPPPEDERGD